MSRLLRSQFLGSATVGERGQIVIPAEARKTLKISSGDKLLVFSNHHQGLLLVKAEVVDKLVSEAWAKASQLEKLLEIVHGTEKEGLPDSE